SKDALSEKAESKTATTTQTHPPTQPDRKEQVDAVKENNQQLSLLDQDQPEKTNFQPTEYILTVDNLLTIDPMIGIEQADIEEFFRKR
ncbi:TPA: ATP-dependent RecD-like DNA helicase, partial [Streptococcus suis]|nr:ATP-dependent RecD-like DNA helicase [Streptococcus suis]